MSGMIEETTVSNVNSDIKTFLNPEKNDKLITP
jgi:hypothetical protein